MLADIALASQTEFGCHMQYFFFELYGGGAGAAKWLRSSGRIFCVACRSGALKSHRTTLPRIRRRYSGLPNSPSARHGVVSDTEGYVRRF